jgi:hypothetical protein
MMEASQISTSFFIPNFSLFLDRVKGNLGRFLHKLNSLFVHLGLGIYERHVTSIIFLTLGECC